MDTRIRVVTSAAAVVIGLTTAVGASIAGHADVSAWSQREGDTVVRDVGPLRNPEEFSQKGDAAIDSLCAKVCHNVDKVFVARRSPRDWALVMADMVRRGAKGSPDERDLIRRYLTWSFGVVAVNSSSAEDLAAVIGLPIATAESIVAHRQRRGRFADMNALAQVEGLDRATLEAQIDALRFE